MTEPRSARKLVRLRPIIGKISGRGSKLLPRLYLLLSIAVAAGFAVPADAGSAGSFLLEDDARVARVGHLISTRSAVHCPVRVPLPGFQLHFRSDYAPADQSGVVARRRLDLGPGILTVLDDSAAGDAGLIAGDVLLAINDQPLFPAEAPIAARAERARVRNMIDSHLASGPVQLRIHRAGSEQRVRLDAPRGCPARVRLARSARATAVADGDEVVVTTGLLREVRSDDELAAIIGHEAAHITLRHADRLRRQGVPRGFLRELGANASRVLATEEEADRLGIKLGWAAGFDMNAAIPFWRRFYAKYDAPRLFRTHPNLAARERIIRETLAELEAGAQRPQLGKRALGDR